MPVEPFKSTSYQVGRIINAVSSDADGNLIFADEPNPNGVTLTQLLNSLVGTSILYDSTDTFFTGVEVVAEALGFLNQFAYQKDTGRFIYVDPTISSAKVVVGEIYKSLSDAITYANGLLFNGYNSVNILVMGSHKQQGTLEQTSDIGVIELKYTSSYSPIQLKKNGLRLIGIGNPVIRMVDFIGTQASRVNAFEVDTDGVANKINVLLQDISFEFVNCRYASALKVKNAPINNAVKERNGLKIDNVSVSFFTGTNANNRLLDVSTTGTKLISNVLVDKLTIGTVSDTTASTNEIELVYVDHHNETVVTVNNMSFAQTSTPNPVGNADSDNVTSFTGIKALAGSVVVNNAMLDEKFYWNGITFANAITKFVKSYNTANVTIANLGIVRNSYNTNQENAGGITTIQDWISVNDSSKISVTGFDEVFNVNVQSQPTTSIGTSSVGSSGTIVNVKPVKSFWNADEIAFGIGHKNELRLGQVSDVEASDFTSYNIDTYGIPFWYNSDQRTLQFFNGWEIRDVGKGKTYTISLTPSSFVPTSYAFSGETTFLGFEANINHNLDLENRSSFTITISETTTGRVVQPQEVVATNVNSIKLVMGETGNYTVTVIGF